MIRRTYYLTSIFIGTLFCLGLSGAHAETNYIRLSDKGVEKLVHSLDNKLSKFERSLDSKIRKSVLRGAGGEVQVKYYLEDMETDIKNLEKRYSGEYAASAEAQSLLQHALIMHGFMQENPGVKGANEWDIFAAGLQQLASSYGADFPLPEGASVRRIGDKELAGVSKALYEASRTFDSHLKKATSKIKPLDDTVKQARDALEELADVSKQLSAQIRSNDPATAQARQVITTAETVARLIEVEAMPSAVLDEWQKVRALVDKVAQAFWL